MSGTTSPHPTIVGPRDVLALKAGALISVAILGGYYWGNLHPYLSRGSSIPAVVGLMALVIMTTRLILFRLRSEKSQHSFLRTSVIVTLLYSVFVCVKDPWLHHELPVCYGATLPLLIAMAFFVYRNDRIMIIGLLVFVSLCFFVLGYNDSHQREIGILSYTL